MKYYDKIAKGYEELYREEQLKKLELIKKELKPTFLLDIGCGTGISLKPWQCKKIGIDTSFELLKQAKNKGLNVTQARAEYLPFKDKIFDTIISISAVHHFNLQKAFKEIKRVGKGKVVVSLPKGSARVGRVKEIFKPLKEIKEVKDLILFRLSLS